MNLSNPIETEQILAVVVTYQPDETLERNLQALRDQADYIIVVDNGSANVSEVAAAAKSAGCQLICNPTNLGIAKAFNQGIAEAVDKGFTWVVTFDQDSFAGPELLAGLLDLYHRHPRRAEIAVIAPTHRDRATGDSYHRRGDRLVEHEDWRIVRSCISSGCLVPTVVYTRLGYLDESLFIDYVDHDFCMRCRSHGLLIIESIKLVLEHSMGARSVRYVLGHRLEFTNHPPLRHYYMTRNQLEVYRRSLSVDFFWVVRGLFFQIVTTVLVLIYEEDRFLKLTAILQGAKDFILRRFGPRRRQ